MIEGLNFSGGYAAPEAGDPSGDAASSIRNAGNLTLQNSVISNGFAQGCEGSAGASPTALSIGGGDAAVVFNNASLTLINTRLERNVSHGGDGFDGTAVSDFGLLRRGSDGGAAATVLNNNSASAEGSSFYLNNATGGDAGTVGIYFYNVVRSSEWGHHGGDAAGGMLNDGAAAIIDSVFDANTAMGGNGSAGGPDGHGGVGGNGGHAAAGVLNDGVGMGVRNGTIFLYGTRNDAASGKVGGTDARADRFVGALSSDTETTQKISRVPEVSFGEQSFDMYDEVALPPRPILEMAREAYEKLSDLVEEMKPQASVTPEVPAETAQQSAEPTDVEASEGQRATDSEPETVRVVESETHSGSTR